MTDNKMIKEEIERLQETAKHCSQILDNANNSDILSVKMLKNEKKRCEQLAEWLEELKMYKSLAPRELVSEKQKNDRVIEYSKGFNYGFNTGYNKAIDDFEEKLLYQIGDLGVRDIIQKLAKQLKENSICEET